MNTSNETTNAVIETEIVPEPQTEPRAAASPRAATETTSPQAATETASAPELTETASTETTNTSAPEPLPNTAPTVRQGPPRSGPNEAGMSVNPCPLVVPPPLPLFPPVRRYPSAHFENSGIILPGVIDLANESRFNAAFFSEPLTEYATGWREPNDLEALLDFIAPPVQVSRRFEYKKADNAEAFLSDIDDARAIGADFKRVEYRGSSVNEKTLNRGLTIRVDLDSIGDIPDWRELFTGRLLQRILRSELRRVLDLLVASATNTNKTWDLSAGKDPDQDILTDLIAAVDASGIRPNRILFGDVAWNKRLLSHRAQATAGGFGSAALTTEQLASFMGVDSVRVSRERYQSSPSAKSKLTPDVVLMFYGSNGVTTEDPTNAKRFWSQVEGGGRYRVYEQQVSAKMIDLTVEHYSNAIVTSNLGLRKLTIS